MEDFYNKLLYNFNNALNEGIDFSDLDDSDSDYIDNGVAKDFYNRSLLGIKGLELELKKYIDNDIYTSTVSFDNHNAVITCNNDKKYPIFMSLDSHGVKIWVCLPSNSYSAHICYNLLVFIKYTTFNIVKIIFTDISKAFVDSTDNIESVNINNILSISITSLKRYLTSTKMSVNDYFNDMINSINNEINTILDIQLIDKLINANILSDKICLDYFNVFKNKETINYIITKYSEYFCFEPINQQDFDNFNYATIDSYHTLLLFLYSLPKQQLQMIIEGKKYPVLIIENSKPTYHLCDIKPDMLAESVNIKHHNFLNEGIDFNDLDDSSDDELSNITIDMLNKNEMKKIKKGDILYYIPNTNKMSFTNPAKNFWENYKYAICCITADESEDGYPVFMTFKEVYLYKNNSATNALFGGCSLYTKEPTTKDNGKLNTILLNDPILWKLFDIPESQLLYPYEFNALKLALKNYKIFDNDLCQNDWYLPSINELVTAFNISENDARDLYDYTTYYSDKLWSSTLERKSNLTLVYAFSYDAKWTTGKNDNTLLCNTMDDEASIRLFINFKDILAKYKIDNFIK